MIVKSIVFAFDILTFRPWADTHRYPFGSVVFPGFKKLAKEISRNSWLRDVEDAKDFPSTHSDPGSYPTYVVETLRSIYKREIKRRWMRERKGFDDTCIWCLHATLAQYMLPRIRFFIEEDQKLHHWSKEDFEAYGDVVFALDYYAGNTSPPYETIAFSQGSMSIVETGDWKTNAIIKERRRLFLARVDRGMKVLSERFSHLWS